MPFNADVGVKQGWPKNSPLIFGLFVDRLERWLARACPTQGARMAGQLLRALFYADDVVLLAESPDALQGLVILERVWLSWKNYARPTVCWTICGSQM